MLHPFKQQTLALQVHRAESLPLEKDGSEPTCFVAVGGAGQVSKPLPTCTLRGTCCPQWGRTQPTPDLQLCASSPGCGSSELFLLREDDLLLTNMVLSLSVVAVRGGGGSWLSSSSSATIAQAHLDLSESDGLLLGGLRRGRTALLHLPLHPPHNDQGSRAPAAGSGAQGGAARLSTSCSGAVVAGVQTGLSVALSQGRTQAPQAVGAALPSHKEGPPVPVPGSNAIAGGEEWQDVPRAKTAAPGSGSGGAGPVGLLVVSCWLQPTWCDTGHLSSWSPDLQPSWCLPLDHLPPGGVMHSVAAVAYNEPPVTVLRIRLLGVWGLTSPTPATQGLARGSSRALASSSRRSVGPAGGSGTQAAEGGGARSAREVGLRIQVHGNELLAHVGNFFGKLQHALHKDRDKKPQDAPAPPPPGPLPSASGASSAAALSRSPSGPQGAAQDGEVVELQQLHGVAANSPFASRGLTPPPSADSPTLAYPSAALTPQSSTKTLRPAASVSSLTPAPSVGLVRPAAGDEGGAEGRRQGAAAGSDPLRHVVVTSLGAGTPKHVNNVLGALEDAGFATTNDAPALDCAFCWLKISCEGQEHISRMAAIAPSCPLPVTTRTASPSPPLPSGTSASSKAQPAPGVQQTGGAGGPAAAAASALFSGAPMSAGWAVDEPPMLLGVARPLHPGNQLGMELDLWASKDSKSRGKSLVKLTAPLSRILEACRLVTGAGAPGADGLGEDPSVSSRPRPPAGSALLQRLGLQEPGGVPAFMDPSAWPQGEVLVQGRMEGGGAVAVGLAVEAVDADDRARMLGLPLLDTMQAQQQAQTQPLSERQRQHSQSLESNCSTGQSQPHRQQSSPQASLPSIDDGGGNVDASQGRQPQQLPGSVAPALASSSQQPITLAPPASQDAAPTPALTDFPVGGQVVAWSLQPPVLNDCIPGVGPRQQRAASGSTGSGPGRPHAPTPVHSSSGTVGYLDLVLHSTSLVVPAKDSGGGGGGGNSGGGAGQPEPNSGWQSQGKTYDCYLVLKSGPYWVVTAPRPIAPSSAPAVWDLAARLPLAHPAQMVTVALFRAAEGMSAARKVASATRAVVGIHLSNGDQLLGRLRLRASQLRARMLHAAVSLPMLGERSQSRGPPVVATCQVSLMATWPLLDRLLAAYAEPPTYGPIMLLQMGCLAGDDVRSPFLGRPGLAVSEEAIERRRRRAALGWLSSCSPALSHRVSRRLLEDGRGDFSLSRTLANWKRVMTVLGSAQPAIQWWKGVQSWQRPWHSGGVAVCVVLAAAWPSRAASLACLYLALVLVRRKLQLRDACGAPPTMVDDAGLDGPLVVERSADESPALTGSALDASTSNFTYFSGDLLLDGEPSGSTRGGSTPQAARPSPPPSGLHHSNTMTSLSPSALDTGFWGHPAGPPPVAANMPPQVAVDSSVSSSRPPSPLRSRLGAPPLDVPPVPVSPSSVPLDPLGTLRSHYDGMVSFLLTVQNVLDTLASGAERMQALCAWSDSVASGLLVVVLVALAGLYWLLGIQWVVMALVLFDMRPPLFRDPWPPPPLNLLGYLPSRADHMG